MSQETSAATVQLLKQLEAEALWACLYAACDLALKAARGGMPQPPENMNADMLVRQIIAEMPPRPEKFEQSSGRAA